MNCRKLRIRKLVDLCIVSLLFLVGCGGGAPSSNNSTPPDPSGAIVVGISPPTASVEIGFTTQFAATVQNDPMKKGVTWSVSGSNCTGAGCGTIDATGKYSAPSTVHDAPGLYVIATSLTDPSKSATAVVFVTPAPNGLGVSPSSTTVPNSGMRQFIATGDPFGTIPVVSWSVSGSGCNGMSCGVIDSTGRYMAPPTAPDPALVTVTATSVVDSSISGSATMILGSNPNNSKLIGQYAFLSEGYDGAGELAMAGSFTADGNGNITNGIADYNFSSSILVATNLMFAGTYSIGSDNRGSMTITVSSPQVFSSGFGQTFSFALGSFNGGIADRGRMTELDDKEIRATGILAKQDPTAFSTAAITGGYAFGLAGTAGSGFPMNAIGRFTASGGSLSSGLADVYGLGLTESGSGTVTSGLRLPFAGAYEVSTNGRGTAAFTFTGQDPAFSRFSFYVVSASELFFLETDTCGGGVCTFKGGISGEALQQSGGPFAAGSLNGPVVFHSTGAGSGTATGGSVAVGREMFNGSGNLTAAKDENSGGVITSDQAFSGTYGVDVDGLGRGEIFFVGDLHPNIFYLVSPGEGFVLDTASYKTGMFEPQSAEVFGNGSISGNFVLGAFPWPYNWSFIPVSGIFSPNGSGSLLGTSDGVAGSDASFSGGYFVAENGRTTMTITSSAGSPSNWVFYLVSPSKAVGVDIDAGTTNSAIRVIEKQ